MQQWKICFQKKTIGPYDTAAINKLNLLGKIPKEAFIQSLEEPKDWQQVSTVNWLNEQAEQSVCRYCINCNTRAKISSTLQDELISCPSCQTRSRFVSYLDENDEEVRSKLPELWNKYEKLASAYGIIFLIVGFVGIISLAGNSGMSVALGAMIIAAGSVLFALSFHLRSDYEKYRNHLYENEALLEHRTHLLIKMKDELNGIKSNFKIIQQNLIRDAEFECNKIKNETDQYRENTIKEVMAYSDAHKKDAEHFLKEAKDNSKAVNRIAERFLDETRKWWTSKMNGQNFQLTRERVEKAISFCRKQGYQVSKQEEKDIFATLKADYEIVLKKELDKAEQILIREKMKEEARAQREYQKELDRLEREKNSREAERMAIEKALADALQKVDSEHSEEVERLKASLQAANDRVMQALEQSQRAKSQAQMTRIGNVYVISNEGSFGINGYKVGLTRRLDPLDRVKELGDASVPFPFDIHMMIRSDDAPTLERKLHRALHQYRINRINFRKEFFRVDMETIRKWVIKFAGNIDYEYPSSIEESEFLQSQRVSDEELENMASYAEKFEDEDDDRDGVETADSISIENN